MDLAKAWGVAIVVYVLSNLVYIFAAVSAADPDQLTTGVSHYLWIVIPGIVIYLLTTLLAAILHGTGHSTGRHILAVLTVPVIGLLISIVGSAATPGTTIGDMAISIVVALIGMVAGWQLVDRFRKEKAKSTDESYW